MPDLYVTVFMILYTKAAPSRDADYGTLRSTRPTGAIARVKIEISAFAEAEVKDSLC